MRDALRIAVACIVQKEGKCLLGKRKGSFGQGQWAFPGGHLESGETIEACAVRELLEETGLKAELLRSGPWLEDFPDEGRKHYLTLFVYIDNFEGEPALLEPHKCEGWEWFSSENLPQPLFPTVATFLSSDASSLMRKQR